MKKMKQFLKSETYYEQNNKHYFTGLPGKKGGNKDENRSSKFLIKSKNIKIILILISRLSGNNKKEEGK